MEGAIGTVFVAAALCVLIFLAGGNFKFQGNEIPLVKHAFFRWASLLFFVIFLAIGIGLVAVDSFNQNPEQFTGTTDQTAVVPTISSLPTSTLIPITPISGGGKGNVVEPLPTLPALNLNLNGWWTNQVVKIYFEHDYRTAENEDVFFYSVYFLNDFYAQNPIGTGEAATLGNSVLIEGFDPTVGIAGESYTGTFLYDDFTGFLSGTVNYIYSGPVPTVYVRLN